MNVFRYALAPLFVDATLVGCNNSGPSKNTTTSSNAPTATRPVDLTTPATDVVTLSTSKAFKADNVVFFPIEFLQPWDNDPYNNKNKNTRFVGQKTMDWLKGYLNADEKTEYAVLRDSVKQIATRYNTLIKERSSRADSAKAAVEDCRDRVQGNGGNGISPGSSLAREYESLKEKLWDAERKLKETHENRTKDLSPYLTRVSNFWEKQINALLEKNKISPKDLGAITDPFIAEGIAFFPPDVLGTEYLPVIIDGVPIHRYASQGLINYLKQDLTPEQKAKYEVLRNEVRAVIGKHAPGLSNPHAYKDSGEYVEPRSPQRNKKIAAYEKILVPRRRAYAEALEGPLRNLNTFWIPIINEDIQTTGISKNYLLDNRNLPTSGFYDTESYSETYREFD